MQIKIGVLKNTINGSKKCPPQLPLIYMIFNFGCQTKNKIVSVNYNNLSQFYFKFESQNLNYGKSMLFFELFFAI